MCEPSTVNSLALGMQVAGAATNAASAYNQSRANRAALQYQSDVAANNAQLAEFQATHAKRRGEQTLQRNREQYSQLQGAQRARLAASGADLGYGSALDLLDDTQRAENIDRRTVEENTALEVFAIREQGRNASNESVLLRNRAAAEKPGLALGTSLINSAGTVASSWYRYNPRKR